MQWQVDGVDSGSPVTLVAGVGTLDPGMLSAGAHTIDAAYSGDSNFNSSAATTWHQTIAKAAADCSSITAYSVTYDTFSHTATGTCEGVGADGTLAGLDLSGTTHTAAGSYTGDPWTFTDVSGNYNDQAGTVDDAIAKAAADCSSITAYSVTYDTFSHTATGTCEGVGADGTLAGLDLSGTTHTAAGSYTGDPWTFTDVSGNYNDQAGTVDDAIAKAAADCSSITAYSVTYDTFSHTATGTCEGVGADGTLAGLDLSGTTHTAAGSYTGDPWTFTDVSGNYNDQAGTVDDAIAKAAADCSSITAYSVTYDTFSHTATGTCEGVGADGTLAGLDLSGTTHTAAGSYTGDPWTFTDVSGNYNDQAGTVDDAIAKAAADCSSITAYSVTYDTFSHTATGTCEGVGADGTLAGLDLSGTTHTAAGSYTGDPWTFTDVSGNYNDQAGTVDDAIAKAAADCSSITAYSVTYDTFSHTATGTCEGVGADGTLAGLDLSGTTHTAAGSYTGDPWTFTDVSGNYNDQAGTVDDAIAKAAADCSSITAYSVTYDTFSHTATGTCEGVGADGTLAGLDLSGTTHTAAGSYTGDPWTFTDVSGNYNDQAGTVDDAIAKAAADCSSITAYSVTYDTFSHTATGTCEGVGADGTLAGLDLSGTTHTAAGSYTGDPWTFTDVSGNYNDQAGTVDDAIAKANTTTVVVSGTNPSVFGQSVTFTATVTAVAPGAGIPSGTVTFKDGATTIGTGTLNGSGVATFSTSSLAVGSHPITATYGGDANFVPDSAGHQVVNKADSSTSLSSGPTRRSSASRSPSPRRSPPSPRAPASRRAPSPSRTAPPRSAPAPSTAPVWPPSRRARSPSAATRSPPFTAATPTSPPQPRAPSARSSTRPTQRPWLPARPIHRSSVRVVAFTATVNPVSPGAGIRSGTVTFKDGATILGTGTLNASGVATYSTSALPVGLRDHYGRLRW